MSGARVASVCVWRYAVACVIALAAAPLRADVLPERTFERGSLVWPWALSGTPAASELLAESAPVTWSEEQPFEVPVLAHAIGVEPYEVRQLPALPGSAGLFLSAMLGVGAWHALRSAKHLHLPQLPGWYHAGAPFQIGSTVRCDLDFAQFLPCDGFRASLAEPPLALAGPPVVAFVPPPSPGARSPQAPRAPPVC